ncbi:MAG: permease [Candidatus Omnitrophica bacterium]|nr:permease [Candidatus Omnitrophota bacterium]
MLTEFYTIFIGYCKEIIPALIIGFFLSGLINEFIPDKWVEENLSNKGIKGILYATFIGALMPVCCWGSLPIAISFYMRGASLGPVLAILIATPATSINALIVTAKFMGIPFAVYLFFSVLLIGVIAGLIGNKLHVKPKEKNDEKEPECKSCCEAGKKSKNIASKTMFYRFRSILKFAYIDMPKRIGKETVLGLFLATGIQVITPIGYLIKNFLSGNLGYLFSLIFGLSVYMCATMGVPLVDAFIKQGLAIGPGFVLLLVGPITSYGTILVLKKEFGTKILLVYLGLICVLATLLGVLLGFLQ